jgi:hypothetical protein
MDGLSNHTKLMQLGLIKGGVRPARTELHVAFQLFDLPCKIVDFGQTAPNSDGEKSQYFVHWGLVKRGQVTSPEFWTSLSE